MIRGTFAIFALSFLAVPGAAAAPSTRSFPAFAADSIGIGCASATIRTGSTPSITASGPADLLERYEVVRDRQSLNIRPIGKTVRCAGLENVHFDIVQPQLAALAIGSSRPVRAEELRGKNVSVSVGGSSRVTIDRIEAERVNLSLGGSGDIITKGRARRAELAMAGSGTIDAAGLASETAQISMTGSGTIRAHATSRASTTIMGSGSITVTGGAKCSVTRMGSGKVRC